jgi:hypothetical protein
MRKEHISVADATEALKALGYTLRVRKERNCRVGWVRVLKRPDREVETLESLTRPLGDVATRHPELIAWVKQHAVIDGSHVVVL